MDILLLCGSMPGLIDWQKFGRRFLADISNTHCLHASLLEAAAANGVPGKKLDSVIANSVVAPSDYFDAIIRGSEYLGLEVVRILVSELLISNPNIHLSDRAKLLLEKNNGDYMVSCPNIRVMFRDNGRGFDCHAECDDNSERAISRIELRERDGWFTGAIAEIRKR